MDPIVLPFEKDIIEKFMDKYNITYSINPSWVSYFNTSNHYVIGVEIFRDNNPYINFAYTFKRNFYGEIYCCGDPYIPILESSLFVYLGSNIPLKYFEEKCKTVALSYALKFEHPT